MAKAADLTMRAELAQNVIAARRANGMTIEQAAAAAGITPMHLRNLEAGLSGVSLAVLGKVAAALSVPPGVLLGTPADTEAALRQMMERFGLRLATNLAGSVHKAAQIESELLAWQLEQGKPLPRPLSVIAAIEMLGGSVNLETGEVDWFPAD